MANFSKFLSLINSRPQTVDLSQSANTLEISGLQMDGSTSGHVVISASATTTTYSMIWPTAQAASSGYVLTNDGTGQLSWSSPSSGSVTSVALALPASVFTVSGSPVTSTGTLTGSLNTQSANSVWAGPSSGSAATPTFRALVAADIPSLSSIYLPLSGGTMSGDINMGGNSLQNTSAVNAFEVIVGNGGLQLNGSTSGTLTQLANATTSSYSIKWPAAQAGGSNYVLVNDGSGNLTWVAGATGTVTSVALSDGSSTPIYSISGSPVTGSGTLQFSLNTQSANMVFAGPVSGGSAQPGFRTLVSADIPNNAANTTGTASNITATSNSTLTTLSALTTASSLASVGTITSGTWNGTAIAATHGGTGATSAAGGFANLSPLTTAGDIIFENATPAPDRLPIGSTGQVLTVVSGLPAWAPASTGSVTSVAFADGSTTPIYAVSGSPVTGAGTLEITLNTQSANSVFAGPSSGSAAQPGFRSLVAADIPSLSYLPLSGGTMSGAINMGNSQINDLATPTASTDAATKGYVDAAINGLTWKGPVQSYAASNVPLTGSTPLVIDGHTVANGDLILLGAQTTSSQNGEYSAAVSGGSYTLTANGNPTAAGDAWLVLDGTVYANSSFVATAAVPAAAFVEFAGPTAYTFSSPLALSGNTVSLNIGNGLTTSGSNLVLNLAGSTALAFSGSQLAWQFDNSTIGVNGSNQAYVPNGGIGTAQLAASSVTAAKLGSVTDGVTLDQSGSGSTIEIKTGGVGTTQLASASVTAAKLGSITDGVTLDQSGSGSTLEIKTGGVGTAQLASASVTAAKLGSVADGVTLDQSGSGSTLEIKAAGVSATQLATGAFDQKTIVGGAGTAASVAYAPAVEITAVYGGASTLTAHTTYAMRWGIPANSETAGKLYLADWATGSFDEFWVVGLYNSTSSTSTGATITIVNKGSFTLGSSDATFGSSDQGKPVWLGSAGTFSPNSTFSPSSGDANEKLGIVTGAATIWVESQMMGVS